MNTSRRLLLAAIGCFALSACHNSGPDSPKAASNAGAAAPRSVENLPVVAMWQKSDGNRVDPTQTQPLRLAIWPDGRVVFSTEPTSWMGSLHEGRISPSEVALLRTAIEETGIYELEGYCYLVPDAEVDCLLASDGKRAQLLYWDEVRHPGYGINIDPRLRHSAFMEAWEAVNKIALGAIPVESAPLTQPFALPQSWYVKQAIQSR